MNTKRTLTVTSAVLFVLAAGILVSHYSRSGVTEAPSIEYDKETGRLKSLAYDANANGKNDTVSYMDGTRVVRIELDLDENAKMERWDWYGEDGKLEKVGFSRLNDGVMDTQAFYNADGMVMRIEMSTRRNGQFDRVEFYHNEVLTRSEEDTDLDGRPDKWETYRPEPSARPGEPGYAITSTAFDDTGRSRPDRRFIYGPGGSIERVEVDPDGDGSFEPMRTEAESRTDGKSRR